MPLEFSFGQIEAVCADLNQIASDKRVAFLSRMKQLQKQGLTARELRPGRGKAGTYSFGDLMKFVIAVELIRAGIMPQMAAKLVTGSWPVMRQNIYICSFAPEDTIGFASKPTQYLWMLEVDALQSMTSRGEGEWDHMDRIWAVPIQDASDALQKGVGSGAMGSEGGWRTLVLNGYNLTQRVMKVVAFHFGYASRKELRDDVEQEIAAEDERVRGLLSILDQAADIDDEQRAAIEASFQRLLDTDFSTTPPTPRPVYEERARDLMRFLPDEVRAFLEKTAPGEFKITEEVKPILMQLIDLGVIDIEAEANDEGVKLQSIVVTPFGEVLLDLLGGEWNARLKRRQVGTRKAYSAAQGSQDGDR